ncbi:MAG: PKD domain-containing protein [Bacteroidia bacterium]
MAIKLPRYSCLKNYFSDKGKCFFLILGCFIFCTSAYSQTHSFQPKWKVNPFDQKVFVENKTQFDGKDSLPNSPILFGIRNKGVQIYFTPKGLTYRHDEYKKISGDEREKLEKEGKTHEELTQVITTMASMEWENSNPNVQIIAEDKVSNYFTYGDLRDNSGKTTIKAQAYKKILYKNLYSNVDVEYSFPENKEGIEYAIILHPGADVSQLKMKYSGNEKINLDAIGNAEINSAFGSIIDHAPITKNQNGLKINSSFQVNDNIVSFHLKTYNHSETVIIDPWVTTPTFAGSSNAYDVDCDLAGNVYIYGGTPPFTESKLNSAGVILWSYTSTPITSSYYGDFAVDGHSQNSYLTEGFNSSGAEIVKVSGAGTQLAVLPPNPNMVEMWRIVYNNCTHTSVIAGGGTGPVYQACVLDTNVTTITPVNILNAVECCHDFALLAQDNVGNCYMATAQSVGYPGNFDNVLLKAPIPALAPTAYLVSDGYTFVEVGSVTYGPGPPNGFNGMATSNNFLYTYDGAILKKWNPATGTLLASATITGTPFNSGGIAVDMCDHIFIGVGNAIKQYDVNLNPVATIPATNIVYDLRLGAGGLLYACGLGFVQSLSVTLAPCTGGLTLTMTSTGGCAAAGTATVTASGGVGPYSYSWSTAPSQNTATATGLSSGEYYVSVTDNSCIPLTSKDSVLITSGVTASLIISAVPPIVCQGDSSSLSVSGATTYSWSPSTGLSSTTSANPKATPPATTTYTVTGTSGTCTGTAQVTVTVNPLPILRVNSAAICIGNSVTLNASGGITYSWTPATGLSSSTLSNPVANPIVTTNYTVSATDNGCSSTASATVTVRPLPMVAFSADTTHGCAPVCVKFTNLSTPTSMTAVWVFGNGNTSTNSPIANNCYPNPGTYTIKLAVTDSLGCSNTASINNMITVYQNPIAAFSMAPQPAIIIDPIVYFTDHSTGGVNQWEWNFGDVPNSASSLQNPQYTYPDTGYYNVQLIVTNNYGCKDSITQIAYIEGDFVLYIPNAFTPNNDGLNDVFLPTGSDVDVNNYDMSIFDRWGNLIFHTTNFYQGWDGKANGGKAIAQEDVYVWKISVKDFKEKSHLYIGHVSLMK